MMGQPSDLVHPAEGGHHEAFQGIEMVRFGRCICSHVRRDHLAIADASLPDPRARARRVQSTPAKIAMTSNADADGRVAGVIDQIEQHADELSDRADEARKIVAAWGVRARRFARNNPGTVLIGAVALGFVLARAARDA